MPHDVLQTLKRLPVAGVRLSSADAERDPADEPAAVLIACVELNDTEDLVGGRRQAGSAANVCSHEAYSALWRISSAAPPGSERRCPGRELRGCSRTSRRRFDRSTAALASRRRLVAVRRACRAASRMRSTRGKYPLRCWRMSCSYAARQGGVAEDDPPVAVGRVLSSPCVRVFTPIWRESDRLARSGGP